MNTPRVHRHQNTRSTKPRRTTAAATTVYDLDDLDEATTTSATSTTRRLRRLQGRRQQYRQRDTGLADKNPAPYSAMENAPSSPFRHGATIQEELAYYKAQYEQLEVELQEFQASSKELEAELEKDVEASEKRERRLKENVESLQFEVEEWKVGHGTAPRIVNRMLTLLRSKNTSSPRPRPIRRRIRCKRKSPLCARRTGRCS